MKELRAEYSGEGEVRGYDYRLIKSDGYSYLYEVKFGGVLSHYEVFERRENVYFDCVRYPRSEHFGTWAFTYRADELSLADAKMVKLSERVRDRINRRKEE